MDYENYVYETATRKRFETFRNVAVNLKRNILSDNRKKPIYEPRSNYLRIIEPKSISMQCGWHGEKEGDNMTATVTNEHLRKEFDNFEKTGDFKNLFGELRFSTLIVPVDCNGKGFAMLEMNGETYLPIFTDIHEYHKIPFGTGFRPEAFEFNFYLEILQRGDIGGFVVNVESEKFPIISEFLKIMDTDYMFDLDYQPFTHKEIARIHDSIDNCELKDFLKVESNRRDFDSLMKVLLKSDLLTVIVSEDNLDNLEEDGVILLLYAQNISYYRTRDNYAMIFSSEDKIDLSIENHHLYSILVNLGLFIDFVLKSDLSGIILDDDIVISREVLLDFMRGFNYPSLDMYDDYAFPI